MSTIKRAGLFIPPFMFFLMRFAGVVCTLMLISCCGGDDPNPSPPKTWTILVYMDADNNLENAALADLFEMEQATSSEYINIIVQLDLRNGITTKRFRIQDNSRELIQDLGELDMASPDILTSFLAWAAENYPADNTVLVLWDHGNGWDQADGRDRSGLLKKSQAIFIDDDNDSSYLSNHETREAIENSGIDVDVIGFDACSMGTIEALFEYSTISGTEIIISSQETIESYGWDYRAIITQLAANPGMSIESFARIVVHTFEAFYENQFYPSFPFHEKRHTISAMYTDKILELAEEVNLLAESLSEKLDEPDTRDGTVQLITDIRESIHGIEPFSKPYVYIDLAEFDVMLDMDTNIASIASDAVIAKSNGSDREYAGGISIVFFKIPESLDFFTFDSNYRDYDPDTGTGSSARFILQYKWDEFLEKYYYYSGAISGE